MITGYKEKSEYISKNGVTSTVYLMDCMEGMKQLERNENMLAVVDPPYGIGVGSMGYTNGVAMVGNALAKRKDYRTENKWDNGTPDKIYFDELIRVSKNQIIWGGNYFADKLYPSKGFIVWDKRCDDNMTNSFSDCEYAWCSIGNGKMFRFLWNGMLQGDMKNKEQRFHPTQKPIKLYDWIFANYAKPNDKILDTHLGSGSSRIAAERAGLNFIGFELDADYYHAQEKRFKNHVSQLTLF
jgi:site-specific DNA-methyltransferase (adenine-specific)